MKYGSLTMAKAYDEAGEIEAWLQLFLRNDGNNVALADGLLLEKRYYLGIREVPIELLDDIKKGTPEYLYDEDSIAYFWWIVERMEADYGEWDVPPLIVEYRDERFWVNDGRHRLEMYRRMKAETVTAVFWTTGEENDRKLRGILGEKK